LLFTATVQRGNAVPTESARSIATTSPQYDDPYADFRNARYSNAGLLNEREEIKLGAQLHREVTKKYNLTNAGLAESNAWANVAREPVCARTWPTSFT
jgi:hypothetical protein